MKLIYLPLEKYRERYTEFLSDMVHWYIDEHSIPTIVIMPHTEVMSINTGLVLDAFERCVWGFAQTSQLIQLIVDGTVTSEDVIYIEDFWHPGLEMIPYTMSLVFGPTKQCWPRIYTFCHAQSVDPNDFTASMVWWMRPIEQAWGRCQAGIFVAAQELKWMLQNGGIGPANIYDVGTVFKGAALRFVSSLVQFPARRKQVVFSSRWDWEKNPDFFCSVVHEIMQQRQDISFVVCTGRLHLSTNKKLMLLAQDMSNRYSENFVIQHNLTKSEYYNTLMESMVQFNCASQDFVSYTLLEAAYYGCCPVYPEYLTFPEALNRNTQFLYSRNSVHEAAIKICGIIDTWDSQYQLRLVKLARIFTKYESSFLRMLSIMGFDVGAKPLTLEEEHERYKEAT